MTTTPGAKLTQDSPRTGAAASGIPLPTTVTATITSVMSRNFRSLENVGAVVQDDGSVMTYGELGRAARRVAGGLRARGLRPGDRAIVVSTNRPELFVVDNAISVAGLVRVPLNYRLRPAEVAAIAADCSAGVVFAESESADALRRALVEASLAAAVIEIDAGPSQVDGVGALGLHAEIDPAVPAPEDIAWLPYTSGTTGEPKGVMLAHRSLLACARNLMVELPPVDTSDVILHVAPLSHLSGYLALTYGLRGATQVTARTFDAVETLRAVERHRVTVLPLVPTMITMLLDEAETGRYDLSSLHTIIYAGSAIAPDRLARAIAVFGTIFVQAYGMTEVPFPLSAMSKQDHAHDPAAAPPVRLSSAGRVSPFIEVRLVGPDGTDVADGEEGEIWARGDVLMIGYWGRPEATADMMRPDGWAATGDVGRFVEGRLHIVDRKKDMIVSGGFNIFPSEIENVISAMDGVHEVAVVGVPDPRWGESVRAVVVLRPGRELTESQVQEACRSAIAAYKAPRSVVFMDALPKTGTGKISRRALRDSFWHGHDRAVG